MPPKQAATDTSDTSFVKLCLKYYKEPMNKANFDFDSIAKEAGVTNSQAAYQKFWAVKKKWGMTSGVAAVGDAAAEGTPSKRGRGRPPKSKKRDVEGNVKDEGEAISEKGKGKDEADAKGEGEGQDASTGNGTGNGVAGDDENEKEVGSED